MYVNGVGIKVTITWSFVLPCSSNPPVATCLQQSTVSYLARSHDNHLVSGSACPSGKIIIQLTPHNHKGYAWLFLFLGNTFCKWGCLLTPIWRGVPLSDNVLVIVLPLVLFVTYWALIAQFFLTEGPSKKPFAFLKWTANVYGVPYEPSPW
jgi:hypothetical protein